MSRAFTNSSYRTHTLMCHAAKVENRTDFDSVVRRHAPPLAASSRAVRDAWGTHTYRMRRAPRRATEWVPPLISLCSIWSARCECPFKVPLYWSGSSRHAAFTKTVAADMKLVAGKRDEISFTQIWINFWFSVGSLQQSYLGLLRWRQQAWACTMSVWPASKPIVS